MNIELKPCPFCGGEAEMMGDQYPYVECQECGAGFTANHSYEFDEDDAASKWNARSTVGPNLKPIAESKVRQLGGDVCGVLVRKDGKLAAVDEHGRVQWLQSERGSEPVAWSWEYRGLHVSADKAFIEKIAADGFAVRPLVFADTQPARAQGGQPENPVAWVSRELVNGDCVGSMAYREKNGDDQAPVYSRAQGGQDLAMACAYCGGAEKVPAQQGSVPEVCDGKEQEAFEVYASRKGYDMAQHPLHYLFINDKTNAARQAWKAAISYCHEQVATPQPEGDGWIKCSERLPTEVDADCFNQVWLTDVSGDGLQMEPWQVDWSFVTKGSGHWKPTGLKRPQPPKEGE